MNRNLPLVLSIIGFLSATGDFCSSAIAAVLNGKSSQEGDKDGETTSDKASDRTAGRASKNLDRDDDKEYNESKLFPKKGNYLDWIEANKLNNQGVKLGRAGNYKRAILEFQLAIKRYPFDYSYYENLGAALHKAGNLERAESTTEMAAQMAPHRWGPWYNLGLILTKEHEYKRALTALKKAKALHAPPSRKAGMNKLIAALERKLDSGNSAVATDLHQEPVNVDEIKSAQDKNANAETTNSTTNGSTENSKTPEGFSEKPSMKEDQTATTTPQSGVDAQSAGSPSGSPENTPVPNSR